jgi:hypothetical protein
MARDLERVCRLLNSFVRGDDRSLPIAHELEAALDAAFPDDDECQELVLKLASYRPGGGEYLYDEEHIARQCVRVMSRLCSKR